MNEPTLARRSRLTWGLLFVTLVPFDREAVPEIGYESDKDERNHVRGLACDFRTGNDLACVFC